MPDVRSGTTQVEPAAWSPDRGQLDFRRGQLEFPGHREGEAIQVEGDLYGERSAGETVFTICLRRMVWAKAGKAAGFRSDPFLSA